MTGRAGTAMTVFVMPDSSFVMPDLIGHLAPYLIVMPEPFPSCPT